MADERKLLYIDESGLHVPIKTEIREKLNEITTEAFGSEFVYDVGSEWDIFLNLLSDCLKVFSDGCKDVFNSMGINTAKGVALDNLVSLGGIQRREQEDGSIESDVQLRYRYADSLYSSSPSVKSSLLSKLLSTKDITYANIIENNTASPMSIALNKNFNNEDGTTESSIEPHSILIIVDGKKVDNDLVADTIFKNKVLGCGTVGSIAVQKSVGSTIETVRFSVVNDVLVGLNIKLKDKTGNLSNEIKNSVEQELRTLVIEKINSLQPYVNISYYDILGCLFEVYSSKGIDSKTLVISGIEATKGGETASLGVSEDIEIFADEEAITEANKIVVEFE